MARIESLDSGEKPPEAIKGLYKHYQKLTSDSLQTDLHILDFRRGLSHGQQVAVKDVDRVLASTIDAACSHLDGFKNQEPLSSNLDVQIYEAEDLPGLRIIPSLIPEKAQRILLSKLLHRDLADPRHKTNVHLHHVLPYHATLPETVSPSGTATASFFNMSPDSSEQFSPLDAKVHKYLTVSQFLYRKLHWVTLGCQYNWTEKKYPVDQPPKFPEDIAGFVRTLFPNMTPEAAILNVYNPGDTLNVHRDVSENSDSGLVSISIGCDGIFVIGVDAEDGDEPKCRVLRLRSGDAVFMSGQARFAWHGVSQIIRDTCPELMRDWPAKAESEDLGHDCDGSYYAWRGWMSSKRINLNIRQMHD